MFAKVFINLLARRWRLWTWLRGHDLFRKVLAGSCHNYITYQAREFGVHHNRNILTK